MVAAPKPIPEPRHRSSDPLDIPYRSSHGSSMARSPLEALAQDGFGASRSPSKYLTPHSASIASTWQHTNCNSFSKTTAQGFAVQSAPDDAEHLSASLPSHRHAAWPGLLRYDASRLRDSSGTGAGANGTPFTHLYRRLSSPRQQSHAEQTPVHESTSFSTSVGSSVSESPATPKMPEPEYSPYRRYAERLDHVDADGMWQQPVSLSPPTKDAQVPSPKEEPSYRRTLQRHLSTSSRRRPSPMSERLLMGHLDTH